MEDLIPSAPCMEQRVFKHSLKHLHDSVSHFNPPCTMEIKGMSCVPIRSWPRMVIKIS